MAEDITTKKLVALKGHKYVIDTTGVSKSHRLVIDTAGVTKSHTLVITTGGGTNVHRTDITTAVATELIYSYYHQRRPCRIRARHRLSNTYYSRTPLQQKLKDFRIIQLHHRVGQHERYLYTNFEADRTNHVGTMTN